MQPKEIDICKTMKINLNHYDFKDVNIVLIPSVPGKFSGE